MFFVVPLFLSVSLGLSAIDTGIRLLPLSITLLLAAAGIPQLFPDANPRRVVRLGLLAMLAGDVVLVAGIEADAAATVVTSRSCCRARDRRAGLAARERHRLVGAGQPEPGGRRHAEHGDEHRRLARHGARGVGADRDAHLACSSRGSASNPDVPSGVSTQASTELASGVPFISDADLKARSRCPRTAEDGRRDRGGEQQRPAGGLRASLAIVALVALLGLFFAGGIPSEQPKSAPSEAEFEAALESG